uniref:Ig-like domain-containing protein n=1 Tax=Paramormyrops kingsleyae TaxID=1676925 RepID=A0A3B3Q948_9TELE
SSAGLISLGCVAGGFSPEDFSSFSWQDSSGNQLSDIYQYSADKNNRVGMVLYLCSEPKLKYEVALTFCLFYFSVLLVSPTSPTVSLVTLPSGESRVDALMCVIQDFYPKSVSVTWKAGDRTVSGQTWESDKGQPVLYSASSLLKLDNSVWESDTVYTCEVQHSTNKTTKTISKEIAHTSLSSRSCLDVTLKPPRVKEMFIDNRAVLECIITGEDKAVKEAEVTWMLDSVQETDKITQTGPEKADHLFRKSSILTLAVNDWEGGKTVKCSVQQKGGPTITKTLSFGQKGTTTPTVSIQTPSPEDLNGKSEFFLLCLVTGFYPKEIYIMWQVNEGEYEEGITGEPVQTGDKYSVTSLFRVSKVDWDKGTKYNCNARHAYQKGSLSVSPLRLTPLYLFLFKYLYFSLFT